ncbi:DUF4198 domain-containing protein [Nitrospirillum sp. BR 11163]|uniref:DUF4198 domain-containing protein n=1 Tax=Nitrospirillum sp. BR 11163 TaxID=3104323 RepID=UPI002AFFF011|nr:DUF4198 domain-containing protein [Nitrospirillum sp. BR 11163]MEA1671979.1 DUF4198 domain-containing protein [Nitrospirillum sp. BR 11163]
MRRFKPAALIALATALSAGPAGAHAIWYAEHARQLALIYGVGADDLDSVKRLPGFEGIAAYDANYQPIGAKLRVAGPLVVVDTDQRPTLVTGSLQNGIWSRLKGEEFEKKTREEMPNAFYSEKTVKYTVAIRGPLDKPIPALPGQVLQIIPVGAIPEKMGAPMTYKVIYNGKPLGGVPVINDLVNDPDATPVKTAADGTVTLPVRNQGLNVLEAVFKAPTDDAKKYDEVELSATLSFVLPHLPE